MPKTPTKTAFVLGFPNLSPKEVVVEAKKVGINITYGHVANIRSLAKKRNGKSNAKRGRPPKSAMIAIGGSAETRFLSLALDLGLSRAAVLLKNVRALAKG